MLYERQELPEIFYLKHLHDDTDGNFVKYDETIFDKTLSPYMFENNLMNTWLKKMQPLASLLLDQMNIMKNLKNYMINKHDYRQI